MMGFIRWKYLLSRLAILAVVCAGLVWGSGPLLRWGLTASAQSALGAKVEIGQVRFSWSQTSLQLSDMKAANPSDPLQNLLQADTAQLHLDRDALLKKRLWVRTGEVRGLRFNTVREQSGELEKAAPSEEESAQQSQMAEQGKQWLNACSQRLLEELEEELESDQVCRELLERWPREYDRLEQRAKQLKDRVVTLKRQFTDFKELNVLRDGPKIEQTLSELEAVRGELQRLPEEVRRVRQMAAQDRAAVDAAKNNDLQKLRQRMRMESLQPEALTQYLMEKQQHERLHYWVGWAKWIRQYIPEKRKPYKPPRRAGRTLSLPGVSAEPLVLLETLTLQGEIEHQGALRNFQGQARDLTSHPQLLGKPAVITIDVAGPQPLHIEATADRTSELAWDRLQIRCPQLEQKERTLGDQEKLAVNLASGVARLHIDLQLRGSKLEGVVSLEQDSPHVKTQFSNSLGGAALSSRVNQSLEAVQKLETKIYLSGSLKKPRWRMQSNLGPQIAEGVNLAMRQELDARTQQLAQKVNLRVERKWAELEQVLTQRSDQLLAGLSAEQQQIAQIVQQFGGKSLGGKIQPAQFIPQAGKLRELFRR